MSLIMVIRRRNGRGISLYARIHACLIWTEDRSEPSSWAHVTFQRETAPFNYCIWYPAASTDRVVSVASRKL